MGALVWRDVRRGYAGGGATLVVAFFLLVAVLFPFAIGPDAALLARVGGGVVWAAALLAALLPVERLVAPDLEAGVIDQLAVRGVSPVTIAAAKTVAHWLAFAPPLLLATIRRRRCSTCPPNGWRWSSLGWRSARRGWRRWRLPPAHWSRGCAVPARSRAWSCCRWRCRC